MIDKNISLITIEDIKYLVENKVVENKRLEYKKELHVDTDSEKKEFLADVSSFSNASGGKIIYGVTENRNDGTAAKINGLNIDNVDSTIQKLENIIVSGIEPRIPSIEIKPLINHEKNYVLIIDIPKSFMSPHRVIYKNHGHFYSRTSNGKYALDVAELRTLFNFSESIYERVRNFRNDRISKVSAHEMPINFINKPKCLLHLIPLTSFDPSFSINMDIIVKSPDITRPIYCSGYSFRFNFEGYLTYSMGSDNKAYSYVQIYKNGIIEAVTIGLLGDLKEGYGIPSLTFEEELIIAFKLYYQLLKKLEIPAPFITALTLIDVKGQYMGVDSLFNSIHKQVTIDRDILVIPEEIVQDYNQDGDKVLKPIFDSVWNSCGFAFSRYYDSEKNWVGRQ